MALKVRAQEGDNIFLTLDDGTQIRVELAHIGRHTVEVFIDAPKDVKVEKK